MSDERHDKSRKCRISGKLFEALDNAKRVQTEVSDFPWNSSRHSEIIKFIILEDSLSLT